MSLSAVSPEKKSFTLSQNDSSWPAAEAFAELGEYWSDVRLLSELKLLCGRFVTSPQSSWSKSSKEVAIWSERKPAACKSRMAFCASDCCWKYAATVELWDAVLINAFLQSGI